MGPETRDGVPQIRAQLLTGTSTIVKILGPDAVVHAFIPATWEMEIGRIMVPGQHRQKINETPISIKQAGCADMCLLSQLLRRER
jgi:hypothetical protein